MRQTQNDTRPKQCHRASPLLPSGSLGTHPGGQRVGSGGDDLQHQLLWQPPQHRQRHLAAPGAPRAAALSAAPPAGPRSLLLCRCRARPQLLPVPALPAAGHQQELSNSGLEGRVEGTVSCFAPGAPGVRLPQQPGGRQRGAGGAGRWPGRGHPRQAPACKHADKPLGRALARMQRSAVEEVGQGWKRTRCKPLPLGRPGRLTPTRRKAAGRAHLLRPSTSSLASSAVCSPTTRPMRHTPSGPGPHISASGGRQAGGREMGLARPGQGSAGGLPLAWAPA